MIYKVRKGRLDGSYKDILVTENKSYAWKTYFEIMLEKGDKKQITGDGKKIRHDRRYWTQGYGER